MASEKEDGKMDENIDAEIIGRNGKLFILDRWRNAWAEPVYYRTAWPTGIDASRLPALIGVLCRYYGEGLYRTREGVLIALEYAGETKPDASVSMTKPIRKPRGCKEYRNGKWVR